jgi:XTP/dITP diphosphohydrolase
MSREERDRLNNERVLRELEGIPDERRTARFVCVMVLAGPDGHAIAAARGTFEGRIGRRGDVPRGEHGFGYDPLFLVPPGYRGTSAQLAPTEKNRLSHRAAAARDMAARLRELWTGAAPGETQPPHG